MADANMTKTVCMTKLWRQGEIHFLQFWLDYIFTMNSTVGVQSNKYNLLPSRYFRTLKSSGWSLLILSSCGDFSLLSRPFTSMSMSLTSYISVGNRYELAVLNQKAAEWEYNTHSESTSLSTWGHASDHTMSGGLHSIPPSWRIIKCNKPLLSDCEALTPKTPCLMFHSWILLFYLV